MEIMVVRLHKLLIVALFVNMVACIPVNKQSPICTTLAIHAAYTWSNGTGDPVGIAIGFTDTNGVRHAQAFTFKDNKFMWLDILDGVVIAGKKHNFYPYEFMQITEFLSRYIKTTGFNQSKLTNFRRMQNDKLQ